MTESISRRTLAKGAAWSVPVVGAAAAVTPASASPGTGGPGQACRTIGDKVLEYTDFDLTTYNAVINPATYPGGTSYSINVASLRVPSPLIAKYNINRFHLNPGFCATPCEQATFDRRVKDAVKGVTFDRTRFVGTVYTYTLYRCDRHIADVGAAFNITVHTNVKYRWGGLCLDPDWQIKGISIPVSITYLRGAQIVVGPCCKYLNLTFPKKNCIGDASPRDKATSLTWSDKPLFG